MGAYFRCRARGELLAKGDGSRAIRWMPALELAGRLADDPDQFRDYSGRLMPDAA